MAKKKSSKKAPKKAESQDEQMLITPDQEKALKLVEKSARVRNELEQAVGLAITRAVRKCMKENRIELTAPEAGDLAGIWFGDSGE